MKRTLVRTGHPIALRARTEDAAKVAKTIKEKLGFETLTYQKEVEPIDYISTGYSAIDDALSGARDDKLDIIPGSGRGLPRGRIIEIFGPEAAAKTTLGLMVIAQAQKQGELSAFVDVEHALDFTYAQKTVGVDPTTLLYHQPDNGEEALKLVEELVRANVSIIVVDSVAALVTMDEQGGGKAMGQQARLMSGYLRKLVSHLKSGGPIVIFINQIRYKIGVVFGDPSFTSGGNALKFYASLRVQMSREKNFLRSSKARPGERLVVGHRIKLKVKKNKVAPMDGVAKFDIMFNRGIHVVDASNIASQVEEAENAEESTNAGQDNAAIFDE